MFLHRSNACPLLYKTILPSLPILATAEKAMKLSSIYRFLDVAIVTNIGTADSEPAKAL